jgi:hypothetical protein
MGFMQGEKPVLSEEGVGPTQMIARRSTKARTLLPLAQDRSEPPTDKAIDVPKRAAVSLLEVTKPAPQEGIELGDDCRQTTAASATRLFSDLRPKGFSAFRAHPAPSSEKIPKSALATVGMCMVVHLRRESGELLLDIVLVGLLGQCQGSVQRMKTDLTIAAVEIGPWEGHRAV